MNDANSASDSLSPGSIPPELVDETYFAVGSGPFYRRVLMAPLCLCLVAGVHLYRVAAYDQTQWKGGGFGMFSTTDSRNARFVRIYLLTDQGEIPAPVPDRLQKRVTELRAAPTMANLESVADSLAQLQWRHKGERWRRIAEALQGHPPDESIDRRVMHLPPEAPHSLAPPASGQTWPLESVHGREALRARGELAPVKAVRIELWRYSFERRSNQITARRQAQITRAFEDEA